jgi:hypothetical protein
MLLLQDIDERALHAETKMRAAYYLGNTKALEKKYPAAHYEPRKRLFKSYVIPAISNSTYSPEGISEVMCHSINCVDGNGQPLDKVCATSIEQMYPAMKEGEVFNRRPEDLEFQFKVNGYVYHKGYVFDVLFFFELGSMSQRLKYFGAQVTFSNHQEHEEIDPSLKKKLCSEVRRLLNDESKVSFDISTRPLKYI